MTAHQLRRSLDEGEALVLDVRQPAEWEGGHIDGAMFVTGAELPARHDEVPDDRPLVVVCSGGFRSAVMASWLRAEGRQGVANLAGGTSAWRAAGYPLV